jgi:hypothetical protein
MLIRRDVYAQLGFYNPAFRQLPDFEMWIRLVKEHPIAVIEEALVGHLRTGANTSAVNSETTARNLTELLEIFDGFFRGIPDDLFIAGFGENFRLRGVPVTPQRLRCEQLFLLLDSGFAPPAARAAALRGFYQSFREPELERILAEEYGFSVFDYYRLTGSSGFGHYWVLAMGQIKPSLAEFGRALRLRYRDNRLYKWLKAMRRRLGLAS